MNRASAGAATAPPHLAAAAPATSPRRPPSELLIRICMGLVSVAMAVALYAHAGFPGWASLAGGIVLYIGLAGLNGEWRNAQVIADLNEEIARLETIILQRGRPADAAAGPQAAAEPAQSGANAPLPRAGRLPPTRETSARPQANRPQMPPLGASPAVAKAATQPAPGFPPPLTQTAAPAAPFPLPPVAAGIELPPLPQFPAAVPANDAGMQRQIPDLGSAGFTGWSAPAESTPPQAAPDAWSFRPADHRAAARGEPARTAPPAAASAPVLPGFGHEAALAAPVSVPPPLPVASSIKEADVMMIQSLIEKLAHDVNAAEAAGTTPRRQQGPFPAAPGQDLTDSNIASSLEALRVTADAMRRTGPGDVEPRLPMPQQAAGGWASPVTANGNHARLAALAEAINAERVDLLLEPILGLEDHRARYYTVHVRPRTASGAPLSSDNLLQELRDTGLLPVLDCTRINRIAEVARRLADRGKSGAVFSEFSAESLGHDRFLTDFAKAYHERDGLSDQLVLSFAQSDVRAFSPRDWSTVRDMRDLGFRFALQDVTDLDMDFARAREHGFDFITLDADVYLNGLPAANGVIPVADLCRYLAGMGLTLIVSHIDDEAKLARIFGFGALLGQGQLFGGPRLLKAEVARAAQAISNAHAAA